MPEEAPPATLPPWLRAPWADLVRAHDAGRTPTGLLLTGSGDVGQRLLALALARRVLDLAPIPHALDDALAVPAHPDLRAVGPEDRQQIPVDAVRAVAAFAQQTARGSAKVVLVDPADRMNRSAANALLKTLEEPAPGTLLVLTGYGTPLLATVASRCQRLTLHVPPGQARAWLTEQGVAAEDADAALLLHGAAPLRSLAPGPDGKRLADGAGARLDRWLRALEALFAAEDDSDRVGRLASELADEEDPTAVPALLWRIGQLALARRLGAASGFPGTPERLPAVLRRMAEWGDAELLRAVALAQQTLGRLGGPTNPNPRLLVHALLVSLRDRPVPSGWPERDLGFTMP